jgi:pSer/pThr/pTyr-binding forkhead associated (FHA) protein
VYCPSCGFHNSEGVSFCARCGASLIADQEAEAQTTVSYTPHDEEGEPAPPHDLAQEGATLVIRSGGGRAGETYPLAEDRVTVGRHPDSTIFLDDVTVSRNHCVIEREGSAFSIVDRGSLNGTYVNRHRVERQLLPDGDELQIGKYKLTFLAQ